MARSSTPLAGAVALMVLACRMAAAVHVPPRLGTLPALRTALSLQGGALPPADAAVGAMAAPKMSVQWAWTILFGATGFELISTYFMNAAEGFSKPLPSIIAVAFYGASFYFFNLSLRALEISVAYAVWSAVVMAALAAIGMTVLGESVSLRKVGGIAAIIVGTVLLSLEQAQ